MENKCAKRNDQDQSCDTCTQTYDQVLHEGFLQGVEAAIKSMNDLVPQSQRDQAFIDVAQRNILKLTAGDQSELARLRESDVQLKSANADLNSQLCNEAVQNDKLAEALSSIRTALGCDDSVTVEELVDKVKELRQGLEFIYHGLEKPGLHGNELQVFEMARKALGRE